MPPDEDAWERFEPRLLLVEPKKFGIDPAARWLPLNDDALHPEVVFAYWQHMLLCAMRAEHVHVDQVIAENLGKSVAWARRQVAGEIRIPPLELIALVEAFRDISLLPFPSQFSELFPPGALPGDEESVS